MTHRERFLKKHKLPDEPLSLREISDLSGFPLKALMRVYDKGIGAYHTNYTSVREKGTFKKGTNAPPSQKLSPQQWAMARVYAFVDKAPKVFRGVDKHIAEDYGLL
jgi:hypothetical protein